MPRVKKGSQIDTDSVVKTLIDGGAEATERKVTVAYLGMKKNPDGTEVPEYATPNKKGEYSAKVHDRIQKTETTTVKIPSKGLNISLLGDTAVKIVKDWLKTKIVVNAQNRLKTRLLGPDKAMADIEEKVKAMGLPEDIAAQVRATLLAGLQAMNTPTA